MSKQGERVRERLSRRFPNYRAKLHAEIDAALATPERVVAEGARWTRVRRAERWQPEAEGESLVGEYVGRSMRQGSYGPYMVCTLRTTEGVRTISGTVISELLDAVTPEPGRVVRVVFGGQRESAAGHKYRTYDLYLLDEGA